MSLKRPVKFFVEVKLNEVPVLDARVKVHVEVINLSGQKTDGVWIELLDNGNGGKGPVINAIPSIFAILIVGFLLIE